MKVLIRGRWFLSVLVISGATLGSVIVNTPLAIAQTVSTQTVSTRTTSAQSTASPNLESPSLTLLPLESTSFELTEEEMALDAIATDINTQVDINIALSEAVEGLTWDQVPIAKDFVDEDGNVDMSGGALPISVSVSNFMEAYGVVLSTDFKVR